MKIALLTDGIFPYVIGGMQKHSYYLAKYLARNKVHVILYHFSQSKEHDIRQLHLFTSQEKQYIQSIVIDFPKQDIFPGHYIRASFKYSEKIFEHLKNNLDVDFIYVKGFSGWKLLKEKNNGFKCPPVGIKLHGMNMFDKPYSFKSRLEQLLLQPPAQFNLKYADYVFSYGGKVTDIIKNRANIPAEKIIEIPTGIEESWLNPAIHNSNDVVKFIFIGRYERLKGIEELMKAIEELKDKYNFQFDFIGPIPEQLRINSSKVHYWGVLTKQEQIQKILQQGDVLVCPSYSEGMPNVVLEAMASGLAIIATDVGAVNTMVSDKNGWLISPGDKKELYDSIKEAIELDKEKLLLKKQHARNFIHENLLWNTIVNQTIVKIKVVIA